MSASGQIFKTSQKGSNSDTSLLQSSLSSFATLSPNTSVADDTDVFSDATISDHDSDAASQVFSTPKQVQYTFHSIVLN